MRPSRGARSSAGARVLGALLAVALVVPAAPATAQDPKPAPDPAAQPSPAPPADPPQVKSGEAPKRQRPDDKRRTMRSYPSNLFYNGIGLFTRGNYAPLAAGFAIVPAAMLLDDEAIDYFERHPHENFADIGATLGGTIVVSGLTVGFFSAGRIWRGGRFRSATYDVSQAILLNAIYTFGLKYAIQRERPDASDQLSFPSGHTSNAFAAATVARRHYGLALGIPAYGVATLIGVSRMAGNRHHFSDIVGGAILGFSIGRTVVRRNSRAPTPPGGETPPQQPPSIALVPDAGPAGDGVGLSLSFAF